MLSALSSQDDATTMPCEQRTPSATKYLKSMFEKVPCMSSSVKQNGEGLR